MIMEQILPDMGFQIQDVWERVSRPQCTWSSSRVVSSAFLTSVLQAVKSRARQSEKQITSDTILPEHWELILWLLCDNWTYMHKLYALRETCLRHMVCTVPPLWDTIRACIFKSPMCSALYFELSLVPEGISVERLFWAPPEHRLFAFP